MQDLDAPMAPANQGTMWHWQPCIIPSSVQTGRAVAELPLQLHAYGRTCCLQARYPEAIHMSNSWALAHMARLLNSNSLARLWALHCN